MSLGSKPSKRVNWRAIGVACWFDPMLGKFTDRELARRVGTTEERIARRRRLFAIDAYSITQAIEPYRHLLGVESDNQVARLCGASVRSVRDYRQSQAIAPRHESRPKARQQRLPVGHPLRPYKALFGHVADDDISRVAGVDVAEVAAMREAFGYAPVEALAETTSPVALEDYHGPLLGFESLLSSMSSARISRTVGVPVAVVDQRRDFLAVPYRRTARASRYAHLFGKVPNALLAKLAGVSPARIADMRKVMDR